MSTISNILSVLNFGWPFLKPYWVRLIAGIILGVTFGLFNASFVWGSKTLFERLDPNVTTQTENTLKIDLNESHFGAFVGPVKASIDTYVKNWLPKAGEEISGKQILGGLLFLPILVGLRSGIGYSSVYLFGWVTQQAVRDIRMGTHARLQKLSLDYYQSKSVGEFTVLLNRATTALRHCLSYGIADSIKEPFTIIGIVIALFILDWELALFGVFFAPLSIIPIAIIGKKLKKVARVEYFTGTEQDSLMVEIYSNMRTIKAFSLESRQLDRLQDIYEKLVRAGMKGIQARHIQNPIIELLSMIGAGVIIIFVFYTEKSVPQIVGFLTGMILLYQPIKKLGGINQYFQEASVGVEVLQKVFDQEPTVKEDAAAFELKEFSEKIKFDRVEFSYGDEVVLQEFDLSVPKGMKLGVVGESGAGKSTLVSLLLRFYDPTKGRVTIDGADIRDITFESLRGQMALVSQEVVIFDQTVAENIACGKIDASREEIVEAARAANAHAFIEALPEGYDTPLGEQGTRLSGGQRQRIAIARAFVRQAPILILDEATAALDSKAEAEVQGAIDRLEEGRTVVCVAHRLSTLRRMDRVIVLEQGRVVESGSFEELLEAGGTFSEMAAKQGLKTSH